MVSASRLAACDYERSYVLDRESCLFLENFANSIPLSANHEDLKNTKVYAASVDMLGCFALVSSAHITRSRIVGEI
jgi:hypothetical protein